MSKKEIEFITCTYKMSDDKPCGKPLHDDKHCIFHSKDIEGKKEEFNNKFWREFEKQEKSENAYDFRGFVFPGEISFEKIEFKKAASFVSATFSGGANFRSATFSREAVFVSATFSGGANFRSATFSREAVFGSATFSGGANFRSAKFSGNAYFRSAKFSGEAHFVNTTFLGKADFESTMFSGKTDFMLATFSGIAYFASAKFSGEAYFVNAAFSEDAVFQSATFSGEAYFGSTTFSGKAYFIDVIIQDVSKIDMVDAYFYNVEGLLELLEETKNERQISKTKTEFLSENIKLILGEKSSARYPIISRQVKDDFFLMSYKEKHKITHFLWWFLADCGRSFKRWAAWSIGIAAVFGFIFCNIGPEAFKYKPEGYSWFSFFYYSIVTFTTLGFGDITPITWETEILVTIEVILGYIMLGGLISILANKLARRS